MNRSCAVFVAALAVCVLNLAPAARAEGVATVAQAAAPATAGSISGHVVNRTTGKVVGGATVTIEGPVRATVRTKTDGSFTASLPPGIYSVTANAGGLQPSGVSELTVVSGSTAEVQIEMVEATTETLRTIGRVTVARSNSLNTSSGSVSYLGDQAIVNRQIPQLNLLGNELPGVTTTYSTGATPNTFFVVRGAYQETKVNIDGHPLSSGTFGNWNSNYANAQIFDSVEVLKGAGLNGPTAGESAIGTVNLRTRDFTAKNEVDVKGGVDSWGGTFWSGFGNVNLLNDKLSVLAGYAYNSLPNPYYGYDGNRIGSVTSAAPSTYNVPFVTGLIQWQGNFSNTQGLRAELAKMRYRFSSATSFTFEYLGLQGQYYPQGGSYATFYGNTTIAPCFQGGAPVSNAASCGLTSVYNPPYATQNIGLTVPTYSWFPNSYIQNNEPQFSAELRSTFHGDTVLVRPYWAVINRFISGDTENRYPGNNGGWYEVTTPANCQAAFASPTAAAGAKGPCFGANMSAQSPAYIGASAPNSVVYQTTSAAPACSPSSPCWTTPTAYQNDGKIGYGSPFSQPEVDQLFGYTFQYLHPFGANFINFSYDYNLDATKSYTNDTTTILAGCQAVIGTNVSNAPTVGGKANPFYQPGCDIPTYLPRTAINIPLTVIAKNDFALSGLYQILPQLQAGVGLYETLYTSHGQVESPAALASATAAGNPLGAPVAPYLTGYSFGHFDPHFGLSWRATPDLNVRATGGSSITTPYAANNQTYTVTIPNPNLSYETTVAYDLGADLRLPDTGIFSFDLFDNTIHNAFVQNYTIASSVPGITAPGGFFNAETINGPLFRSYGAELTFSKSVPVGFGYYASTTFQRAYLDQLPASLYFVPSALVNGAQLQGNSYQQSPIPYVQGYYELRLNGSRNSGATFGMQYEGANNYTFGKAFELFNASGRLEVSPGWLVNVSVDNLFGFSTGTDLGRSVLNQGSQTLTNVLNSSGQVVYGPAVNKSLQEVGFRTYRFSLQTRF
jgi:outer membrane receptor protein involved in Fe transport